MDRKKLVLLVAALIVAVGARTHRAQHVRVEAVRRRPKRPRRSKPRTQGSSRRALPVGTIITADALGFQLWPEELVQDAYFLDGEADMSKLLGTVVRHPITAGEPVTQGALVAGRDRGFLAAALAPGMRAITVPVNAQSGVPGCFPSATGSTWCSPSRSMAKAPA